VSKTSIAGLIVGALVSIGMGYGAARLETKIHDALARRHQQQVNELLDRELGLERLDDDD
jgi:hypothetical protein